MIKLFFCVSCHIACPDEGSSVRYCRADSYVCEDAFFLKHHRHEKGILTITDDDRDYGCLAWSYLKTEFSEAFEHLIRISPQCISPLRLVFYNVEGRTHRSNRCRWRTRTEDQ